jgi:hypothetical protein
VQIFRLPEIERPQTLRRNESLAKNPGVPGASE